MRPRKRLDRLALQALQKHVAKSNSDAQKDSLLALLRNLVIFVAIYLYFIGWTYSYYLYSHFGVSLYSLDVPFYYFFVYSYGVISSNWKLIIVAAAVFPLVMLALRNYEEPRKLLIGLLLLAYFPAAFSMSKKTAFESALLLRQGYGQTIRLVFKETDKKKDQPNAEDKKSEEEVPTKFPKEMLAANNSGELRLLTQTKDRFFVLFQPPADKPGGELPMCYTYIISSADIMSATIEAQNIPNRQVDIQTIPR